MLNKNRLIKNSLRECTIVRDKQQQKKEMSPLLTVYIKQKSSANLTVVGLSDNRAVLKASKIFEPKRFAWRLNKVGEKHIQEQRPN